MLAGKAQVILSGLREMKETRLIIKTLNTNLRCIELELNDFISVVTFSSIKN